MQISDQNDVIPQIRDSLSAQAAREQTPFELVFSNLDKIKRENQRIQNELNILRQLSAMKKLEGSEAKLIESLTEFNSEKKNQIALLQQKNIQRTFQDARNIEQLLPYKVLFAAKNPTKHDIIATIEAELAENDEEYCIRVIDTGKGALIFTYKITAPKYPQLILFNDTIAFTTGENSIELWNYITRQHLANLPLQRCPTGLHAISENLFICALPPRIEEKTHIYSPTQLLQIDIQQNNVKSSSDFFTQNTQIIQLIALQSSNSHYFVCVTSNLQIDTSTKSLSAEGLSLELVYHQESQKQLQIIHKLLLSLDSEVQQKSLALTHTNSLIISSVILSNLQHLESQKTKIFKLNLFKVNTQKITDLKESYTFEANVAQPPPVCYIPIRRCLIVALETQRLHIIKRRPNEDMQSTQNQRSMALTEERGLITQQTVFQGLPEYRQSEAVEQKIIQRESNTEAAISISYDKDTDILTTVGVRRGIFVWKDFSKTY